MNYYFLGIGGIGMSALARYFKRRGDEVAGYDRTPSPLTHELEQEGIAIHYEDAPQRIPAMVDKVIYTPAIPTDTREYQALATSGIPMQKRSQALGELTRGKKCIAVAGSHGKTSTSAMIAHLLDVGGVGCSAFLGGISKNINSNLQVNNDSEWVVVEADEYDRSFLQLHPFFSVITATDPDHLDIYGTHRNLIEAFQQFANQTDPEGRVFLKQGIGFVDEREETVGRGKHFDGAAMVGGKDMKDLGQARPDWPQETTEDKEGDGHQHGLDLADGISAQTYGAQGIESDYYAINVRTYRGNLFFDMRTPQGVYYDMQLTNSSLYNVENAVAACAVAFSVGLSEYQVRDGLKTFQGVRRRFDYRINEPTMVYIDDYAHHPKEIAAAIASVRYLFEGKRVVGVFQPHLYSRTADLYKEFAEALSPLDEVVLMDIYPAREKPIPGVTSRLILNGMKSMNRYLVARQDVPDMVVALCPDVVLTMGAGDIDRMVPDMERALRESMG